MEHQFTDKIKEILNKNFGANAESIFERNLLIQYLNEKTRSANRGSKSRSSFANLYAIYVIVEDYLIKGYDKNNKYSDYSGAEFNKLFARQRELPFGSKLQNHGLNHRMNSEFEKYFPSSGIVPILRKPDVGLYWINENLLKITIGKQTFNLAKTIIDIIDDYICAKQSAFLSFIEKCNDLQKLTCKSPKDAENFVLELLAPNTDARLFEIVSFSILKYFYFEQEIFLGFEIDKLEKENLNLYKTGRTNANDGGIDFVMRPLGRFFQVTETLDFKKYFLDIDKIQKYPISFIVKSNNSIEEIMTTIKNNAEKTYPIKSIVEEYMNCIEEIINISELTYRFQTTIKHGLLSNIINEIILQSKVEFNYEEQDFK